MDLLLHPPPDPTGHRPDPRGRLSTVGHGAAFRAFARAAKRAGIRFMVIGGTYRDVAVRAASTRDIDVVLVDQPEIPRRLMEQAGFRPVAGSAHAWTYAYRSRNVELQVAALASSTGSGGPFSVALAQAQTITIEGVKVSVPLIEDYVILKLLAARDEPRRRGRDLTDVQDALEAFPDRAAASLSVPALRARMRDLYGIEGQRLKDLVALLRAVPRP